LAIPERVLAAASLLSQPRLEPLLRSWLAEDIGRGDLSAAALVGRTGSAGWTTRRAGIFCGGLLVEPLFRCWILGVR
jgi:nicotinate-nucleotide pyrophosphorylase (carboxylating)